MLKERISNILSAAKKRGIAIFSVISAIIVAAVIFIVINFNSDPSAENNELYTYDYDPKPVTSAQMIELIETGSEEEIATAQQPLPMFAINEDGFGVFSPANYQFFSGALGSTQNTISGEFVTTLYHYDLDTLHTLLFDEPVLQEHFFSDITSLDLSIVSQLFNVQFI